LRRDSPQASRSRHCRAGRLILSLLIPGCSVAGDQDPSRFPVRARCRVGVRNASSPDRGRDLPCRALGKTDSGGGWLRVQLEQPGVLLLRRRGPAGRGEWQSPCSDTLVWACSSAEMSVMYKSLMSVPIAFCMNAFAASLMSGIYRRGRYHCKIEYFSCSLR